ncbi:MAG: tRNA preQ1(34) S-adenosylmethionine ribosyltransferase-isomerase QueA [Gammaproteobacteria bacterium]|nr:tRNA preQ1(34) S-adenosylmethionine ribosyltransferase-isomerase QueA [Gammaproteobacteria bacterium]
MKLSDFDYDLPPERIAHYPLERRSQSRLMVLDQASGSIVHQHFYDLPQFLNSGDLLVFNDSRVIPARLLGRKQTGGKVEILIERILAPDLLLAHVKASHIKPGHLTFLDEQTFFTVLNHERLYQLQLTSPYSLAEVLQKWGHIPLPPYIARPDEVMDQERYQTVYAKHEGSVAAPTAGLHFDAETLAALQKKGVQFAYVTLHVGAGTFQPVKVENILEHVMHSELIFLPQATVDAINEAKARGSRVISVGTTATRTLESVAKMGPLHEYLGETDIFIYPDFKFKVIDAMITNFHLPKSSLLMMIAAFSGYDLMRKAYELAVQEQYRFFSYGDAMLIFTRRA